MNCALKVTAAAILILSTFACGGKPPTPPPAPPPVAGSKPTNATRLVPVGETIPMLTIGAEANYKGGSSSYSTARAVSIRSFWIAITETTQGQWEDVMGGPPSNQMKHIVGRNTAHPVDCVSWIDAIKFCNKLSQLEGLQQCYDKNFVCDPLKNGYRLPTTAEWALACFGNAPTVYPWGDNWNNRYAVEPISQAQLTRLGAMEESHTKKTQSRRPNENGLYDMIGNVSEWCDEPMGEKDEVRKIRGGDWTDWKRESLKSKWIGVVRRHEAWPHIGFRVVRNAEVRRTYERER